MYLGSSSVALCELVGESTASCIQLENRHTDVPQLNLVSPVGQPLHRQIYPWPSPFHNRIRVGIPNIVSPTR